MNYVQSNSGGVNPATTLSVALSTNVAVGDLIVVGTRLNNESAPTDNLGNTYTRLTNDGGQVGFYMYRCIVTTGGACTVTVTQGSSVRIGMTVHHYSSADSTPLDQETDVNSATATSSATDAFTTGVSDGVVVGVWGGAATPTPEADYGGANLQANTTGRIFSCHRLFTSTLTSETVDWTHSSVLYQVKAASFKTAAGGGGAVALAGTIAALSTIAGTLAVSKAVQGIIAAVSSLSGTLASTKPLDGIIAAQSTLSGSLNLDQRLAGVVGCQSVISGELTMQGQVVLAGTIATASEINAALSVSQRLSGVIGAGSTITADFDLPRVLVGNCAALSSLAASLGLDKGCTGILIATSSISASMQVAMALAGLSSDQSALSAVLSIQGQVGEPFRILAATDRGFIFDATSRIYTFDFTKEG